MKLGMRLRRQVNIADAEAVIECEAARHDPDDGVGGVIDFQRSPDDVGIAAEVALPEAVVENNDGVAAVLGIGWLDVAAEKRAHTKERSGILCEVGALDVFRQCSAGDLHVPRCRSQAPNQPGLQGAGHQTVPWLRRNQLHWSGCCCVDDDGVHDAVGAGVGKRVQQDGVDEREHRRGGADAERE